MTFYAALQELGTVLQDAGIAQDVSSITAVAFIPLALMVFSVMEFAGYTWRRIISTITRMAEATEK